MRTETQEALDYLSNLEEVRGFVRPGSYDKTFYKMVDYVDDIGDAVKKSAPKIRRTLSMLKTLMGGDNELQKKLGGKKYASSDLKELFDAVDAAVRAVSSASADLGDAYDRLNSGFLRHGLK